MRTPNRYSSGPWKAAAVRYSAALRDEMDRRGMNSITLARAIGVSCTAVGYYRQARYIPRPEIAGKIAEALTSTRLAGMTTMGAVIRCDQCGRERFRGTTRRRYCSNECRTVANQLGLKQPVSQIQSAVDLFCRACEPEGVCRTAGCQLQPFSPLPLARRVAM